MSTLADIEAAIAKLPPPEFRELLHKLNERDAAEWDRQIEDDAQKPEAERPLCQLIDGETEAAEMPGREARIYVLGKRRHLRDRVAALFIFAGDTGYLPRAWKSRGCGCISANAGRCSIPASRASTTFCAVARKKSA